MISQEEVMADPKFRFDIEARDKGEADVEQLGTTLRRLGHNLECDLKKQALGAADALYRSNAKRDAVTAFQHFSNESQGLAVELAAARKREEGMLPLDEHANRCMTARRETLHK